MSSQPDQTQDERPDDLEKAITDAAEAMGAQILSDTELAAILEQGEREAMGRDAQARAEGRRFVNEETDGELIETWWAEAGRCASIDDAAAFAQRLVTDYRHDSGTICHAIGAASYAMAKAMNASPSGQITGFQAGAVQWMWLRHWNSWDDAPRRLVDYSHLLFPQYDRHFTEISRETAVWLTERAVQNLAESPRAHPNVVARWRDIAVGRFPAFIRVEEEA